jgi:hypothetical protein
MTLLDQSITATFTRIPLMLAMKRDIYMKTLVTRRIVHAVLVATVQLFLLLLFLLLLFLLLLSILLLVLACQAEGVVMTMELSMVATTAATDSFAR